MKYLLDTCVISDFVKGIGNTIQVIKETSPQLIAVSSITIMEIEYGLAHSPQKAKKISTIIHDLLSVVTILPFSEKEAVEAGKIRSNLRLKGTPIGAYDILIAGTAFANDITLVTSNTREFERIDGLKIQDWRIKPTDAFH